MARRPGSRAERAARDRACERFGLEVNDVAEWFAFANQSTVSAAKASHSKRNTMTSSTVAPSADPFTRSPQRCHLPDLVGAVLGERSRRWVSARGGSRSSAMSAATSVISDTRLARSASPTTPGPMIST